MAILGSANHTIVDVSDNFVAVLTNDSHTLPANSSGTVTSYAGAITKMNIYLGVNLEVDTSWTYSVAKSSADAGFTATIATNGTLTVSAFPAALDSGFVDITATKAGISLTKRLTITKSKQGAAGATARTFYLEPSVSTIVKSEVGTYTPTNVVFSSFYKDGTNATKVAQTAYWRIETTLDGVTWTQLATQTTLSSTYTVSSIPANIIGIRATTYSTTALTVAVAYDTQSIMVVLNGAKGQQGDPGPTGTSITGVAEYYLATSAATGVTTATSGWSTTVPTMTSTNKYLWNYEKTSFSNATSYDNSPVIIGVYGDTGGTGATGRSITSVVEYYLASASASGVTRATSGWTTTMQTTLPTKKYLWNYEVVNWSSAPTVTYVEPIVIGVHGDTGSPGTTTYTWVKYADDENGTGMSDSPTGKRYIGLAPNKTTLVESSTPGDYNWSPLYDNVIIGARNLLPESGNFQSLGAWGSYTGVDVLSVVDNKLVATNATTGSPRLRNSFLFQLSSVPVDHIISVEYISTADLTVSGKSSTSETTFNELGSQGIGTITLLETIDYGNNRKRRIFKWVSLAKTATIQSSWIMLNMPVSTVFEIVNVQVERGNVASAWGPALEDINISIAEKATAAQDAADTFSEAQALLAIAQAEAYADGRITDEETARINDATAKLAEAKLYAEKVAGEAAGAIDLTGYATNQIVIDLETKLKKEISSVTGLNLFRNSIGYAGLDYWEHTVVGNESVTALMNQTLRTLGYGSGFYFPPQTGTTSKGIQQTMNVTPGQPYTLSWFLNRATTGAFIVSIYEGTTLKQTIPDGSNVNGEFSTEYFVYIPEGNQLTIRFEAEAATEALLTGVMLGLGTMPTQWTLANGELYNAYVRIDDNGLVVIRVDENGEIEGFTNMTPEEFAGYYDENRDGNYERIFWFNRDETVTKKLKALDEITMGTIKVIRVEGALNRGWAFVPIIPE